MSNRLLSLLALTVPLSPWASAGTPVTDASGAPSSRECFEAAIRGADWLVANQVRDWSDANRGRFLAGHNPSAGETSLSDNWMTGAALMALLMVHRRTGDARFLEAAEIAGAHLMSLQILDPENPHRGAFREITAQTTWCYPRDALTAAWALLWLHAATRQAEPLRRVELFVDWFEREAMGEEWPLWEVNFRGEPHRNRTLEGSFHGGDGAFFCDHWRVTGDDSHLPLLRRISDHLTERFLSEDGRLRVVYDRATGLFLDEIADGQFSPIWKRMHRYNDDFSAITLMDAHLVFGEPEYLERAEAFAGWLIREQQPDGSFGQPPVASASATAAIELVDLHRLTGKETYLAAARRAGRHLLTLQETASAEVRAHGGFYEMTQTEPPVVEYINLRTSAYAIIALLKLEGVVQGPCYAVAELQRAVAP